MRSPEYRLGLVYVTISAVAWSTAGLFTRLIDLDSWTLLVWRGIFGAVGISAAIAVMEGRRALPRLLQLGWGGWLYAVISAAGMIFFITSLRQTTVAHVAVIYATVPLLAAALGWLVMRERPAGSAVLASIAALGGVALMVGLGAEGNLWGDLLAFCMTLCMAVLIVFARHVPNIPAMPAACWSAVLSSLVCWHLGEPLLVSGTDLVLLALFGVVNSAVGMALFAMGARLLPAIETALIGALDAPLAPLWVWLVFGETPGAATVAGGLVVFVAVGVHMLASVIPDRGQ